MPIKIWSVIKNDPSPFTDGDVQLCIIHRCNFIYRPAFQIRAQRLRQGIGPHSHKNTVRKVPTLYARYYQLLSKCGLRGREKLSKIVFPIAPNCGCISLTPVRRGDRGSTVVKVLCYKSEGRWFDSRWCHWNFSLT